MSLDLRFGGLTFSKFVYFPKDVTCASGANAFNVNLASCTNLFTRTLLRLFIRISNLFQMRCAKHSKLKNKVLGAKVLNNLQERLFFPSFLFNSKAAEGSILQILTRANKTYVLNTLQKVFFLPKEKFAQNFPHLKNTSSLLRRRKDVLQLF
jgi:hypothetical protein